MKLGRRPSKPDKRTLQFGHYIDRTILPPSPTDSDWYAEVWNWPMYANDTLGDCTMAALGHQWNAWTKYATGVEGGPTLNNLVGAYKAISPHDTGADMLTTLRYMQKHPFTGDSLAAYAAINVSDRAELETAISLFGSVYMGMALPNGLVNAMDMAAIRWIIPANVEQDPENWIPNPNNGHAICAVGYHQEHNYLDLVTWGRHIGMSWQWCNTYCDEAYVLVSEQWLKKNGTSPSGVNLEEMLADVAIIKSVTPVKS